MLDDAERAELEKLRRQEMGSPFLGWILAGLLVLTFGSCTVGAYKADAFFYSTEGSLNFGIDIMKMARYYRGDEYAHQIILPGGQEIPLSAARAASASYDYRVFCPPMEVPPPAPKE